MTTLYIDGQILTALQLNTSFDQKQDRLDNADANLDIGSILLPNNPTIKFHSSGHGINSFDAQIALTGGNITNGQGNLTITAGVLNLVANTQINGNTVIHSGNIGNSLIFANNLLNLANSIELGLTSQTSTPYIDFHSSGNNIDYDARIIAGQGTNSIGQGTLSFQAGTFLFTGSMLINGSTPVTAASIEQTQRGNPKRYGAFGDGLNHPLSSITNFIFGDQKINATGYTLANWQTIFPKATNMTNNLDRLALQYAVDDAYGVCDAIVTKGTHILLDATLTLAGNLNFIVNGYLTLANQVNSHIIRIIPGANNVRISGSGILDGNKNNQTGNNDPNNFGNGGIVTNVLPYPQISNQNIHISELIIQNVLNWPVSINNTTYCSVSHTTLQDSGNAPQFCNGTTHGIASNNIIKNIPDYAFACYEGCSFCTIESNISYNSAPFGCLNDGDANIGWQNVPQHDITISNNIIDSPTASGITVATVVVNGNANFLYNIIVKGNIIYNSIGAAIVLAGCNDSIVEGNSIRGGKPDLNGTVWNGITGIGLNLLITGNTFTKNGDFLVTGLIATAINLQNFSACIITNNFIRDDSGTLNYAFSGNMGGLMVFKNNTIASLGGGVVFAPGCNILPDTIFIGSKNQNGNDILTTGQIQAYGSLEIGQISSATTPYLDFHSSGNNIDYDARILAYGGTTSIGQAALSFNAKGGVNFDGPVRIGTRLQYNTNSSTHRSQNLTIFTETVSQSGVSLTSDGGPVNTNNAPYVMTLNSSVRVKAEIQVHNVNQAIAAYWTLDALVACGTTLSTANIAGQVLTLKIPGTTPAGYSISISVNTTNGIVDIAGTNTNGGACYWQAEVSLSINGG